MVTFGGRPAEIPCFARRRLRHERRQICSVLRGILDRREYGRDLTVEVVVRIVETRLLSRRLVVRAVVARQPRAAAAAGGRLECTAGLF